MDFPELRSRLKKVGIGEEELTDGTLRRWATTGLIIGPKRVKKPERQGAVYDWKIKSAQEAAAVWALRNLELDQFHTKPSFYTIQEVKFEAQSIHKKLRTDINAAISVWGQESFGPKGVARPYLKSFGLHPFIVTWIATIEKVRRNWPVGDPARVDFNWNWHVIDGNDVFKFDGTKLRSSKEDAVRLHAGYMPEAKEKLRAKSEAVVGGLHGLQYQDLMERLDKDVAAGRIKRIH